MRIEGVPEGPAGSQRCKITFDVDKNGVLKVSAQLTTDKSNIVELECKTDGLSLNKDQVELLAMKAELER